MKRLFVFIGIVALGLGAMSFFAKGEDKVEKVEKTEVTKAVQLTDAEFNKIIKEGVTLVDFWATWCPPCRKQGPIVDAIAKEFGSKATIAKLDVDKNRKTASAYAVQSIPTIIIFKDGKVVERFVGLRDKEFLSAAVNKHLK